MGVRIMDQLKDDICLNHIFGTMSYSVLFYFNLIKRQPAACLHSYITSNMFAGFITGFLVPLGIFNKSLDLEMA